MSWTCPRCRGYGEVECGDPHASNMVPCQRCRRSGNITSLLDLREAVQIADASALQVILKEQQNQPDLDWCLVLAIKSKWLEHVRLLQTAGADAQAGLRECVRAALAMRRYPAHVSAHVSDHADILRVLLESGAAVGDAEMQYMDDVLPAGGSEYPEDSIKALEAFRDVLASGQAKALNLDVHYASSKSWFVSVHNLAGECVYSVDVDPSSMTFGALQSQIEQQASIPRSRQDLIHGGDKIDVHAARPKFICDVLCNR